MNKEAEIKKHAKEIKNVFSPESVTDVYDICDKIGIEIFEEDLKADAYLKCIKAKNYIFLKKTLDEKRKRFTLAHELGHLFLPWHSELMFGCDISELDDYVYKPKEREANMFAAELLMPEEQFKKEYDGHVKFQTVSDLANQFEVSFKASLSRSIEFAKEDCMVICSCNRRIKWHKNTKYFPLRLSRMRVGNETAADELFDSGQFKIKELKEPAYIWFGDQDNDCIVEESIRFPNYDEVISIIHLCD